MRDSFCKDIRWDHPRVCGEKSPAFSMIEIVSGSPPRMRGKGVGILVGFDTPRITPAYAGKSPSYFLRHLRSRDHPRVCGEKALIVRICMATGGSPPRMRGKANRQTSEKWYNRITPAYAGKRLDNGGVMGTIRDHPRVCGEKGLRVAGTRCREGSPPRMRGKGPHPAW